MHPALQGALIGLAIGAFLVAVEYFMLKKAAEDRAVKMHRKPVLEEMERRRIATVFRFGLILPIGFALGFWIIWG
jgi:hypothetical protein